jgi:RNA polymerase sigma factor (sigma-70 family)
VSAHTDLRTTSAAPIIHQRLNETGLGRNRVALGSNFEGVLQAARLGADWAWTQIYRDLSPSVLRYLRAQGAKEPEDLLGDVFLCIVRAIATFEGTEPEFRAWVFKCSRNALIDSWRREGRRPVEYVPSELLVGAGEADSAEAEAMRRLAYDRVQATLGTLSRHQREVIFLRVVAGLSIDEVAIVLGRSPGSVKSLQSRGLATLRREISREAVSK